MSWLWQGYLAPGTVTALIRPPRAGKTALVSHLLARFAQGGQLAGLAIAPGRALVVSEEAATDWDVRCRRLALGPNLAQATEKLPQASILQGWPVEDDRPDRST